MRFAKTILAAALVLFAGGAAAVLPPWALGVGAVLVVVSAVAGAVALEERDLGSVEGLVLGRGPRVADLEDRAAGSIPEVG